MDINAVGAVLYMVSLVLVCNWILLHFFLAILLDRFSADHERLLLSADDEEWERQLRGEEAEDKQRAHAPNSNPNPNPIPNAEDEQLGHALTRLELTKLDRKEELPIESGFMDLCGPGRVQPIDGKLAPPSSPPLPSAASTPTGETNQRKMIAANAEGEQVTPRAASRCEDPGDGLPSPLPPPSAASTPTGENNHADSSAAALCSVSVSAPSTSVGNQSDDDGSSNHMSDNSDARGLLGVGFTLAYDLLFAQDDFSAAQAIDYLVQRGYAKLVHKEEQVEGSDSASASGQGQDHDQRQG